jgi:hypothetical protein
LTGAKPSDRFAHGMLARVAGMLAEVDRRIRALIAVAYAVCCDETRCGPAHQGRPSRPGAMRAGVRVAHRRCCQPGRPNSSRFSAMECIGGSAPD